MAGLVVALDDTLAGVREIAPAFAKAGIPPAESIPHISVAKSEAWHKLDGAARRYASIRSAQFHVENLGAGPARGDMYTEFRDPVHPTVWGSHFLVRHSSTWRPWPEGRLERMLWLANLPVGLVAVLTGAEQDELPTELRGRSTSRFTVLAAEANDSLVPCGHAHGYGRRAASVSFLRRGASPATAGRRVGPPRTCGSARSCIRAVVVWTRRVFILTSRRRVAAVHDSVHSRVCATPARGTNE